jgi:hypothetical protein
MGGATAGRAWLPLPTARAALALSHLLPRTPTASAAATTPALSPLPSLALPAPHTCSLCPTPSPPQPPAPPRPLPLPHLHPPPGNTHAPSPRPCPLLPSLLRPLPPLPPPPPPPPPPTSHCLRLRRFHSSVRKRPPSAVARGLGLNRHCSTAGALRPVKMSNSKLRSETLTAPHASAPVRDAEQPTGSEDVSLSKHVSLVIATRARQCRQPKAQQQIQ